MKKTQEIEKAPTDSQHTRYAFVPIVREFRGHTQKNRARLWIPFETSLLVRYEFASCSLQTRYVFVAIVLFCGAHGTEQIPLDAKFMSSVLLADERTIEKSFEELISKNLLVERTEREKRKEKTTQTDTVVVVCDSENLFQNENADGEKIVAGNFGDSSAAKTAETAIKAADRDTVTANRKTAAAGKQTAVAGKQTAATGKPADASGKPADATGKPADQTDKENNAAAKKSASMFSLTECLKYAEQQPNATNPQGLATHLFRTGDADAFILAKLYPEKAKAEEALAYGAPVRFTADLCTICFGSRMSDPDGKGYRKCAHCKDERGKSTGFEPQTTGATKDVEK